MSIEWVVAYEKEDGSMWYSRPIGQFSAELMKEQLAIINRQMGKNIKPYLLPACEVYDKKGKINDVA